MGAFIIDLRPDPPKKLPMATIESLLNSIELPDSPSPRLDAELLLADALGKPRSYPVSYTHLTLPTICSV